MVRSNNDRKVSSSLLRRRDECAIAYGVQCPRCLHRKIWRRKSFAKARCCKCGYEFEEKEFEALEKKFLRN